MVRVYFGDTMKVRNIENLKELEFCVDLYLSLNDETFMPACKKSSMKGMKEHLGAGAKLRVLEDDGVIIAWILFKKTRQEHLSESCMQQLYYAASVKGLKAAKAVHLLHNEMEIVAKEMGLKRLISTGSHMDENFVFAKLLERAGWSRRGYLATKWVDS
jgi:hypothetical protein